MNSRVTRYRRLRHSAVVLAAAVVVAGGLATVDASASPRTPSRAKQFQSSPRMVNANGHKLAFYVTPGRLPAIVLDAGGGNDASYWENIVPVLAKETGREIITYDRSGEGRSPYVPGPWKAPKAASDLAAGLRQLKADKNVTLVSHSLAGEIATYYVKDHPRSTAGAVLVDANLPQFFTRSETAKLVAANQAQIDALKGQPITPEIRQLLAEAANYGPVHNTYHKQSWPRTVPVTAIVSSETPFPTPDDAQLWRTAQQQFVDAGPHRNLVVADPSSHDVPLDRPEIVVKAVEDMVNQGR
ncbi:hypothetical protein QR77_10260 [Streptomyces sp. 150FB]|uniref:alpha/beta fold hydrolase n=1 Tax=Streptomyces sp. 150FB TaxID=1576605 RepID=UPI0005891CB9|nr:alpha/beta hydrolase [Streptomyces sp. 150FB]KIF74266.1 hypothetical protein QR77_10260 [Streptomyces sp. 150FB]